MTTPLPHLPDITTLTPRIIRILGGNPSKFTLQGTNTYLVGTGPKRILVDTGDGVPDWRHSLQKALSQAGGNTIEIEITDVLLTHWHHDHVSGVPDLLSLFPTAKIWKNRPDAGQTEISDGQVFRTDGATLTAFYCPGHAIDHMAFILAEENAMFTADNVLGHGTAVFEDLALYLRSLEGMKAKFSGRAYPGHGAVVESGVAKIEEYIRHRREREEQILGVLKGGRDGTDGGDNWWTSMDIVKVVYKGYPENLFAPAEGGVMQALRKLEGEGKVNQTGSGDEEPVRWRTSGKAAL